MSLFHEEWGASCDKQTLNNKRTKHRGAGRIKHNCRQMKQKFGGWDEGRHRGTDMRKATTVITDTDVNKSHCIMQHMGLLHLCSCTHTRAHAFTHEHTYTQHSKWMYICRKCIPSSLSLFGRLSFTYWKPQLTLIGWQPCRWQDWKQGREMQEGKAQTLN